MSDVVEKVKQVFGDFDVVTFLEQHNVKYDEWLKSQIFQLLEAVEKEVLKILEDREQKLRELADLLKTQPCKDCSVHPCTLEREWFRVFEKKFAELGLDTKKEDKNDE